jgi:hypothetical protein
VDEIIASLSRDTHKQLYQKQPEAEQNHLIAPILVAIERVKRGPVK